MTTLLPSELKLISNLITNRSKFSLSTMFAWKNFSAFSCCCRCFRSKKDKRLSRLVKNGEQKIEQSLDLITLVKNNRTFKQYLKFEMTKLQNELFNLNRKNLLEMSDSSGASTVTSEDEETKK